MNEYSYIPIKLYLHKQSAGSIWPLGISLLDSWCTRRKKKNQVVNNESKIGRYLEKCLLLISLNLLFKTYILMV